MPEFYPLLRARIQLAANFSLTAISCSRPGLVGSPLVSTTLPVEPAASLQANVQNCPGLLVSLPLMMGYTLCVYRIFNVHTVNQPH